MNRDGLATVADEPYPLAREEIDDLRAAAADGWRVFARAAELARTFDDATLLAMGFPANALEVIRLAGLPFAVRFDCIRNGGRYRIIECNADTPFLILESFARCGEVLARHGVADPNAGEGTRYARALARTIASAAPAAGVAVTAYGAAEDRLTGEFVRDLVAPYLDRPVRFAPLGELAMRGGRLHDRHGTIDVLVRLYPLEFFAADPAGDAFLDAVRSGALRIIAPPGALLLQNKLLHVPIWHLANAGAYFTPLEQTIVKHRFLPAFAERPASGRWVSKPALGREGRDVVVDDAAQAPPAAATVWQHMLDAPVVTCAGRTGHAVASCFVIDGAPSAVAMRVGALITDATAFLAPISHRLSAIA